ncbi:MAG TPA: PP2C family serine/threonine-protein phosphatase [Albitalea sp.]|nr:PP2C family serine/threonine-protein phosphatase [Albitalea sp.]
MAAGSLITPLEPASPHGPPVIADAPAVAQQAMHTTAWGHIDAAVASSRGSQHASNEDAHSALGGAGRLFVVADGVGGGAMAQLASRELVAQLHQTLDAQRIDADRIRAAMLDADRAIARRIAQVTESPGAATVALCAPVNAFASKWLVAWVGDCRVYRLATRGEPRVELLTRDDTFRHLNEAPPSVGSLDDPARMVGNGATAGASVAQHELACGDLLVLCSDGVHKFVGVDDWCRLLTQPVSLARRCEDLIALARANGSVDDATVLLLQRAGLGARWPRWIRRIVGSVKPRRARR